MAIAERGELGHIIGNAVPECEHTRSGLVTTCNKSTRFAELDGLLHQPVRTRIAAFLAARGETSFTELKRALELTDGNLDAHMKKLVNAGYIHIRRAQDSPRTQTVYTLSEPGRQAFVDYVNALEQLLMR